MFMHMCVCVHVSHACGYPQRPEEVNGSPETRVGGSCDCLNGCRELLGTKLALLEERQVLRYVSSALQAWPVVLNGRHACDCRSLQSFSIVHLPRALDDAKTFLSFHKFQMIHRIAVHQC